VQGFSFGITALVLLAIAFVVGLAFAWAGPAAIFAAFVFAIAFGAFLVNRGVKRARTEIDRQGGPEVPTTSEASADPVRDSSLGDAARTSTRPT
jgi:uncharacterized membrane protein YciS (DUF1049 family)